MTYELYLGDRTYSSWSLRGWLLFEKFGLTRKTHFVDFNAESVASQLAKIAPAKTVPTLVIDDQIIVSDSLAMAEELASRHPEANLWPTDPGARAIARTLASEMHSGFSALRTDCPMNLRVSYEDVPVSPEVQADLRRLEEIWAYARKTTSARGPWLCGEYSIADAFFAPVAGRIAGYRLAVDGSAQEYVDAHLSDPAFRRWRAMGFASGDVLDWYSKPYREGAWPGPKPLDARAVDSGESENDVCPYSGKDITHLAAVEDRVFGFCNAACRDKTVADPEAFPQFMSIYRS